MLVIIQKLKMLRNNEGSTQYEIAEFLLTSQKRISQIENGKERFYKDEVEKLKKRFNIVDMPLTEGERKVFREKLYHWRNIIRSIQINEAKEMQNEVKNIVNLELCDFDLAMLYRLFEALLFIADDDLEAAKEKLDGLEAFVGKMTAEHRYYYDFHMGWLCVKNNDFEKAIKFYRQALSTLKANKGVVPDSEDRVYENLAICYTELEQLSRAVIFLGEIPKTNDDNKMTSHRLGIDITRAINYYKIGEHEEAEEILNDCYSRAKATNNKLFTGLALQNLGIVNTYTENWEKAIGYFDRTLKIFDEDSLYYAWALHYKIRCLVGMRNFLEAEKELKQVKPSIKDNPKNEVFLKGLRHIIDLNRNITNYNKNAVEYLENTAIPFYIEKSARFEALYCYKLLERHFIRTSKMKKSLETNRAMFAMRERMV